MPIHCVLLCLVAVNNDDDDNMCRVTTENCGTLYSDVVGSGSAMQPKAMHDVDSVQQ